MIPKIIGVDKRYLPRQSELRVEGYNDLPYTVVLVEGDAGDYAAYSGLGEDAVFVARYGEKISFEEAQCHFPMGQLKTELYRR